MVTEGINGSWCGGEGGWRVAGTVLVGGGRQEKGGEWTAGWDGTDGAGLGQRAGEGARERWGG